jgi:hypothetical protein
MEKSSITEIEFQLRKLVVKFSEFFAYHQWPSEHDRWLELIFALVTRISRKDEEEIREIVEMLDDLNLLSIQELSEITFMDGRISLDSHYAKRISEIFSESGFTEEEAHNSILVIHETARSLTIHHDGKIQKYLRKYGQQMIDELSDNFSFSKMNHADVKFAFTYWLQNVLGMPISLEDKYIEEFCKIFGEKPASLVQAADNLDVNLAIVDDMAQLYLDEQKTEASPSE